MHIGQERMKNKMTQNLVIVRTQQNHQTQKQMTVQVQPNHQIQKQMTVQVRQNHRTQKRMTVVNELKEHFGVSDLDSLAQHLSMGK